MSELNVDDLRRRLVEIDDEIRGLPDEAFASKHKLNLEADRLRATLSELLEPELDAANAE